LPKDRAKRVLLDVNMIKLHQLNLAFLGMVTWLLAAASVSAFETTPAAGTLSLDTPVLEFSGTTDAAANVTGVCITGTVDCDEFALTVDLPSDVLATYPNLKIRVSIVAEFDDMTGDYDLYVNDASGTEVGASATASGSESTEIPALAGTNDYTVVILPYTVLLNSYAGTVELIGLGGGGSGGGAGDGPNASGTGYPDDLPLTDVPRTVVSVIDSGVNPYHAFYHAGSPIYPIGAEPTAVSLPVLQDFGIEPDCAINLKRTGDFAADYQADVDSGLWEQASICDMVWFVGTNVLAKTFGPGSRPYLPDTESDTHGVGTSAAVLFANPEAVLVFVEGISDASETFAMTHPAIDFVSTSYGAIGSIPSTDHLTDSFVGTYDWGKLHFGACDNSPSPAIQDSTCGPWWSVGIAGFEETQANEPGDSSNGRQIVSGTFPDFIADFTQTLPYCAECEDGYDDGVGGTSFATPRSAGTASKILLEARRALNYLGGAYIGNGRPLMAAGILDGQPLTITNWQLRRALEEAAWVPGAADYDPALGVGELAAPILDPAAWVQVGWGVISPADEAEVISKTLSLLGITDGDVTGKDAGFCEFQNGLIATRKLYWDTVTVDSQTFLNAPSPDPYIYCDSTAALTADTGDGSPQDSDGDTVTDDVDNCPVTPNTDQADADADGSGDACEKGAVGGGEPEEPEDPEEPEEPVGDTGDDEVQSPTGSAGAMPWLAMLWLLTAVGLRRRGNAG